MKTAPDAEPGIPPTQLPRPVFPAIDVLRSVAATLVIVFHVIALGQWETFPTQGPLRIFRNGWVGVDLFFVISGFVIALAALSDYDRQGKHFKKGFAIRRFARIAPLYILSGVVFLFITKPELLAEPIHALLAKVAAYVLFVQNLHPLLHGAINGPSWSVALEMQFYIAILWLTPWLARVRPVPALACALLLAALYRLATTIALVPGQSVVMEQFIYLTQLPGVIDQFALGMFLALAVHHRSGMLARALMPSWRHFLGWAAAAALLLLLASYFFVSFGYWDNRAMLVLWRPVLSMGFCALVASAVAFPVPTTRWLAPFRYAGTISYGLYLWHFPVLVAITSHAPHTPGPILLVKVLVGTTLLAILSWHLLEKPCIQRFKTALVPASA